MSLISKRQMTPTTGFGEEMRQVQNGMDSMGIHEKVGRTTAIVSEVNPKHPRLVKAHSKGVSVANGNWFALNHTAQEIAERWGTIREGFVLKVTLVGPTGSSVDATVVGTEGQTIAEPPVANEVARGMFAIFTPGIGL